MRMLPAASASLAFVVALVVPALASQVSFEQTTRDLASPDPNVRLHAAQLLKEAAYQEGAVPLARLITDSEDEIQLEAIAAELNIFLAEKIVTRKRVGFVIEVRNTIAAAAAFSAGPVALGPRVVPPDVLTALRAAARDANPRVALEAIYAFGALAVGSAGGQRRELLRTSGPDLAAMIGVPDPAFRFAAIRVIGRVYGKRPPDEAIDAALGDAVITAVNDRDRAIRLAAIQALGAMRYERAVEALTSLFAYYGRGEGAEASLDALARIAHASSAPLFVSALTVKSSPFRATAIEGLARLGDRQKVSEIQVALGAERGDRVLLAGTFATVLLSDAPIDPLVDALLKPKLRDQARQYLIELVPGRAEAFGRLARDPAGRSRVAIIEILGDAGDPAALPVVEPLIRDRDPQVARAAERAAARLR